MLCSLSPSLWRLVALASFRTVVHASMDPGEYFGGQDHQGYLEWIATSPFADLTSTAFIASSSDPTLGAALHWSIDSGTDAIELAVATKSTGWLGFGLSKTGGMLGTDIFVVEANDLTEIRDMHVLDTRVTQLDECQNWELMSADISDDGFFMVRVKRLLDTGDPQDLMIHNDGDLSFPISFVIAAWGDEANHGYHGANRARSGLRWYSTGASEQELFADVMEIDSATSVFIGASNYSIKLNATDYAYFCALSSDLVAAGIDMDSGVTVIGFEPVIDQVKHLHHYLLYASTQEPDDGAECNVDSLSSSEVTYIWAPGEPPFAFPDNVGMALGGNNVSGAYRTYVLQVHYDNVEAIPDQVDSSGVRVFYTQEPREYAAGVSTVGDPYLHLVDQKLEQGVSSYLFECGGSCSSLVLQNEEPVTVIREYLHMHQAGYAMYNEHIRNEQVIRTGAVDFYDFDQSGGPSVQQEPFQILPGDSFKVRCFYKNDDENRTFGQGSAQEMCMAFLLYYPRKNIPISEDASLAWLCGAGFAEFGLEACDAAVTTRLLNDGEVPELRTFGTASAPECSSVSDGSSTTSVDTSGGAMPFIVMNVHSLLVAGMAILAIVGA